MFLNPDKLKIRKTEIDQIRYSFKPITLNYDSNKLLDKERNTYYGVDTNKLRNKTLIEEYIILTSLVYYISYSPLRDTAIASSEQIVVPPIGK